MVRSALPIVIGALIGAAFLFITALAALSSFTNVSHAAETAGYDKDHGWWLPAMVDGGIFAFTALGLFVSWRWRDRLEQGGAGVLILIRGIVWLLVGYTLVLNTGRAASDPWTVAAHSVGGALVALSAEVIEQLLRKLHIGSAQIARRIPRRRWFARPFSTARIWLLMHAWDMTFAEVLDSERQRIREKVIDKTRASLARNKVAENEELTSAQLMGYAKPKHRQLLRLMDAAVKAAAQAEAGAVKATGERLTAPRTVPAVNPTSAPRRRSASKATRRPSADASTGRVNGTAGASTSPAPSTSTSASTPDPAVDGQARQPDTDRWHPASVKEDVWLAAGLAIYDGLTAKGVPVNRDTIKQGLQAENLPAGTNEQRAELVRRVKAGRAASTPAAVTLSVSSNGSTPPSTVNTTN